jgi:cyclophilin family peptidyl-prolyl cis-trans isomerase
VKKGLLFVLAISLIRCAAGPKAAPRAATGENVPAEPPPAKFSSALEAEASLLMLEDERSYDSAILGAAARSPEPSVRARAAHAIGSIGEPRGLPLLESLAADGEATVRAAGAFGLELLGDSRGRSTLEGMLQSHDAEVVCAASHALARMQLSAGEVPLVAAVNSAPLPAKPCLLYAVAAFGTETAASAAREVAVKTTGELRRAAVYAFCRNPVAPSFDAIALALRDADPDSAAFAARAFGVLRDARALPALVAALERREPGVLASALNAIDQIEEATSAPPAAGSAARIVSLASDANPNVAIPAITVLRHLTSDRDAIRTLNSQATSGVGRRREVALASLIRGLGEKSRSKIDAAIASEEPALRAAAAEGLSGLPEDFVASYRPRLLQDANPHVREIALASIPADAAHREAIRALLGDPDPGVRSTAIDRLAETGSPAILEDLGVTLAASRRDKIADAALSSVAAASRFPTEEARSVLTAALSDPRPLVSRAARTAILDVFHADASALPAPAYPTGRSLADYERILREAGRRRRAVVRTARGQFSAELDGGAAPLTVDNFVQLASKKFFDNTTFHRVVPNFVIQGGDPTATQHGGPGYEIRDELQPASYGRGAVGMALGGPDTGGSQFFVTLSPQPHLDGRYPLFGQVVNGMAVVERIEQGDRVVSVSIEEVR